MWPNKTAGAARRRDWRNDRGDRNIGHVGVGVPYDEEGPHFSRIRGEIYGRPHHLDPSAMQRAMIVVVRRSELGKRARR